MTAAPPDFFQRYYGFDYPESLAHPRPNKLAFAMRVALVGIAAAYMVSMYGLEKHAAFM